MTNGVCFSPGGRLRAMDAPSRAAVYCTSEVKIGVARMETGNDRLELYINTHTHKYTHCTKHMSL